MLTGRKAISSGGNRRTRRLLGVSMLNELVRNPTVPGAKLAQKAPAPTSAGRASMLLEKSEVEEQDGHRGDEKRRKPGLHDDP